MSRVKEELPFEGRVEDDLQGRSRSLQDRSATTPEAAISYRGTIGRAGSDTETIPSIVPQRPGPGRLKSGLSAVALAAMGAAVAIAVWKVIATVRSELPTPAETLDEITSLLANPFQSTSANGKGILLQLASSLQKVFMGFGVAALVGIPAGFVIGASKVAHRAFNPLVQILRPVSPLAWFPIALVLFKDARWASILTIGITALWPTLINTAAGVAAIPQDHRNVARVFRFSRAKYIRHVLLPYSTASIITGLRLSMGIGWMVIVATEMLSGGTGIGFFAWDSYNNNNLEAVASAILFIGVIGFVLDMGFGKLARKFDYSRTAQ